MLNKLKNRPLWYKAWAILTGILALYTLVLFAGVLIDDSFAKVTAIDYFLAAFVQLSILLEMYLFPEAKGETAEGRRET